MTVDEVLKAIEGLSPIDRSAVRSSLQDFAKKDSAAVMAEQERRREEVPIRYRFTIRPSTRYLTRLWDSSLAWYTLFGEVANPEEAKAAGHLESSFAMGSMRYLYNRSTQLIVHRDGGGHLYIPEGSGSYNEAAIQAETARVYKELGEFIHRNPGGGDVTGIVLSHRYR